MNISQMDADVTVLETFNDSSAAITRADYPSGAKAFYLAFSDYGYDAHVSILVRLIQQYSGIPYKAPYYSYELDDGGESNTDNTEYIDLVNFTKNNLGGYPTISLEGKYMDNDSLPGLFAWGQSPSVYYASNARI